MSGFIDYSKPPTAAWFRAVRAGEPIGGSAVSDTMRYACLALLALAAAACSQEPAPPAAEPGEAPAPAAAAAAAAEPGERFRYTRLEGCELIRSAPEEAGFFEHECDGVGGYRLRHSEADLRENVVVLAPGGSEHDLELSLLARGAFSTVGETAEWRSGPGGPFDPAALILRQSVMEDPDPNIPEVSYLVVVRLTPRPCVVARVPPGPGQNTRARETADRAGPCIARSG